MPKRFAKKFSRLYAGKWTKEDVRRHSVVRSICKNIGAPGWYLKKITNFEYYLYKIPHRRRKALVSPENCFVIVNSFAVASMVGMLSRSALATGFVFLLSFAFLSLCLNNYKRSARAGRTKKQRRLNKW